MSLTSEVFEPLNTSRIDILLLLKLNPDAKITVRHIKSGRVFPLALNFTGDVCYIDGNSKKIIVEGVQGAVITLDDLLGYELTEESIDLISTPAEKITRPLMDPSARETVLQRIISTRSRFWKGFL